MSVIRKIGIFLIVLFAVVLLPGLPPWTTFPFQAYDVTAPAELNGIYELNTYLNNADHILVGKVNGPEGIISRGSAIFTSNNGGEVLKIIGDSVSVFAKFGKPCELPHEEAICGRPLGLAFDTITDSLLVADGYYGIWSIDINSQKKTLLVSPRQILDGKINRSAKVFNSVIVDKRGVIYWTDSSSDYGFEDGFFAMLANPSGRLFRYDRFKNESTMLVDEINFANGIVLSPNEDFIVIAETGSSQLLKYQLQGSTAGKTEIFASAFPGNPDNLTPDDRGIWVPLVMPRDSENPAIFQLISPYPILRRFMLRIFTLFEFPFRVVDTIFPNRFCRKVLFATVSFNSFIGLVPPRSTILRLDWDGTVVGVLHGSDKSIRFVSQVLQTDSNTLYLASPFNDYLGKIKLPEGFNTAKRVNKEAVEDKIHERRLGSKKDEL